MPWSVTARCVCGVTNKQKQDTTDDGLFAIEAEEETTNAQAVKWVSDWTNRAQTLWEATPSSVVERLKQVEDMAVHDALLERQKQAEERLRQKLEAQAQAHQEAMEVEHEKKADEARLPQGGGHRRLSAGRRPLTQLHRRPAALRPVGTPPPIMEQGDFFSVC